MRVTVKLIVTGVLRMIPKDLVERLEELEIGGRAEIIQSTALLRSDGILRKVLETGGDMPSLKLQWKTFS